MIGPAQRQIIASILDALPDGARVAKIEPGGRHIKARIEAGGVAFSIPLPRGSKEISGSHALNIVTLARRAWRQAQERADG